jgi:hypothetical protein
MLNGKKGVRGARPWDLLSPPVGRVSESIQKERFSICQKCPLLNPVMKTCSECGCLMVFKTKLPNAFCPKGKWGESEKE